jgi:hypothetical protein
MHHFESRKALIDSEPETQTFIYTVFARGVAFLLDPYILADLGGAISWRLASRVSALFYFVGLLIV